MMKFEDHSGHNHATVSLRKGRRISQRVARPLYSRNATARLARISQVARYEFARLLQNRRTSDG
jgi:hypothetical protein